jgi:hypothetical protein
MRLLAATFPDQASARVARTRLLTAFTLRASDIGVELLAHGRDDVAILAGRFREDAAAPARRAVEALGGTLVVDMDAAAGNA